MTERLDLNTTMHIYAQEAVNLARAEFQITLDYSELSLLQVELILDAIYTALPKDVSGRFVEEGPLAGWIQELAVVWGAYLGEVVLQIWGGEWTVDVPPDFGESAALHIGNAFIYPISKVYKRLVAGESHGVVLFYEELRWRLSQFARLEGRMPPAVAG